MNPLIASKLDPIAAMPLNCQSLGLLTVKEHLVGTDLYVEPQSLVNECNYVCNYYAQESKKYLPRRTSHTSYQPPEELKSLLMPTRHFTHELRKKMDDASAQILRHNFLDIKKSDGWNAFKKLDSSKQWEMLQVRLLNDVSMNQLKPEVQARLLSRCQQAFDKTVKTFEQEKGVPPDLAKELSLFEVADEVEAKFSLNEYLEAKRERQAEKATLAKINKYCGITSAIEQGLTLGLNFAEQYSEKLQIKKEHFQMMRTGVKVASVITQAAINLSMGNFLGAAGALISGFSQSPEEAIANRHREVMEGLSHINKQIIQVQTNQHELKVEVRRVFATIADLIQTFQADHNRHFEQISSQLQTIQQDQLQIYDRIGQAEQTILEAIKNLQFFAAQKLQANIGLNLEVVYFTPCNNGKALLDSFQQIEKTSHAFINHFRLQKENFRAILKLFNDGFLLNEGHIPYYLLFATWCDEKNMQWMNHHYLSQLALLNTIGGGSYCQLAYPFETFMDLLDPSLPRRGNPLLEKCLTSYHFKNLLFPEALAHLSEIFIPLLPFFTFAENGDHELNLHNLKMEQINQTKLKIEAFLGRVQLAIAQFNLMGGDFLIQKVGDDLFERLCQPQRPQTPIETAFIKHALEKGKMVNALFARNLGKWLVIQWQKHKSMELPSAWLESPVRIKEFFGPGNVVKEDAAYEGHDGWHFTFKNDSHQWTIPLPNLREFRGHQERLESPLAIGELIRLRSRLIMQHVEYVRALQQDQIHQKALKLFALYNLQ